MAIITLNVPKNIDLDDLYPDLQRSNINHIIFLIHQINFYTPKGGYQINNKNFSDFFGVGTGKISKYLKLLKEKGIIKKISGYKISATSNTYVMVSPFNSQNENEVTKVFFDPDARECPVFIKKWVADNYLVVSKDKSSYDPKNKVKFTDHGDGEFISFVFEKKQYNIFDSTGKLQKLLGKLSNKLQLRLIKAIVSSEVGPMQVSISEVTTLKFTKGFNNDDSFISYTGYSAAA